MNTNRPRFEMRHRVTFEDTNAIGNVYFTNFFAWQGKCRECFLLEKAPETFAHLRQGTLRMVTAHASCDYVEEAAAGDALVVRMGLSRYLPFGVGLAFEFAREDGEVIARGRQDVKFLRIVVGNWALCDMPQQMADAVRQYE